MVLTVSFVLSPAIGLFCHRRWQRLSCQLDASVEASGPHDFSVRQQNALVRSAACGHRIQPRVRDDRDTPLEWGGRRRYKVICGFGKPEYFFERGWTGRNRLIRLEKLDFTRKSAAARREDPQPGSSQRAGTARRACLLPQRPANVGQAGDAIRSKSGPGLSSESARIISKRGLTFFAK
jgi:hypothetical protein